MKISILKRIEALKLPADLEASITEDEKDVILTLRFAKEGPTESTPTKERAKRPPRVRGDKDVLATFSVKTPLDGGPSLMTMGEKSIKAEAGLIPGVIELLGLCGIKPELVAAYPDSDGKRQIMAILGE